MDVKDKKVEITIISTFKINLRLFLNIPICKIKLEI